MVYPLRSYIKLFSTSSFPVCNQRKTRLTNSQKNILIINLCTDKQDRSEQGDHPSQVSTLRQNQKQHRIKLDLEQSRTAHQLCLACHFWCSYAAARTRTITLIPLPAPQNQPKILLHLCDAQMMHIHTQGQLSFAVASYFLQHGVVLFTQVFVWCVPEVSHK